MDILFVILENPQSYIRTFLTACVVGVTVIWYAYYLWKRRYLYMHSWNVKGPLAFPIIGSGYLFIGKENNALNQLVKVQRDSPTGLVKVWLGSLLVYLISDPNYTEKVLSHSKALEKGTFFYKFISACIGHGLLTAPVQKWKLHRKLLAPSFNQKVLDSFVEVFVEQSKVFSEQLETLVGQRDIDLYKLISNCTLDIVCETAMGVKVNSQRENGDTGLAIQQVMQMIGDRIYKVWYHLDFIYNVSNLKRNIDRNLAKCSEVASYVISSKNSARKKLLEVKQSHFDAEIEEETTKKRLAFLDLLLRTSNITQEELRDEVNVFMAAGTETTATSICCLFSLLGMYPKIQQKVYGEVIDIIGTGRDVLAEDLPKMKYTERVIKETLRLFPVAAVFSRNIEENIDIGDYILPVGSCAAFVPFYIHRHPAYWQDPLKFDPDRFLQENMAERHPCTFIPFSYGPRNCIGWKFAIADIKTIIATVIRQFEIFSKYKTVEEIEVKMGILMGMKYGSKVWLEKRSCH